MRVLSKLQSVMINESIMAHDYRFQFFWCCDVIFRIFILSKPINMKRYRSGLLRHYIYRRSDPRVTILTHDNFCNIHGDLDYNRSSLSLACPIEGYLIRRSFLLRKQRPRPRVRRGTIKEASYEDVYFYI